MSDLSITPAKEIAGSGWLNGFIGVVLFSGSLPATKLAILGFSPLFLTFSRATIAGLLAMIALCIFKEKRPGRKQIVSLIIVALGVVLGYPLLSALALQHITSAHSIVFVGLLPLATALFGVWRGGERPRPLFWLFSILGSLLVIGYAVAQGLTASLTGDLLMLAAIIVCGLGYAEGARLSKTLGGWQVISWALIISLPVMLPLAFMFSPVSIATVDISAWLSLAYVSLISMFIAFIFWYKGLAQGGVASVGQLQLLQPFFGLALAALLLHEQISWSMLLVTIGVIACVAGSKRFGK